MGPARLLLALLLLGVLPAADPALPDERLPSLEEELMAEDPIEIGPVQIGGEAVVPGRSAARSAASPQAFTFEWDRYRTLVVVGEGLGTVRPAWVVTSAARSGRLAVAYRGLAYLDAGGLLHIDARRAVIAGPMAQRWSPDSFALVPPKAVSTLDDENRGNLGTVVWRIDAAADPAEYGRLLRLAQEAVANSG